MLSHLQQHSLLFRQTKVSKLSLIKCDNFRGSLMTPNSSCLRIRCDVGKIDYSCRCALALNGIIITIYCSIHYLRYSAITSCCFSLKLIFPITFFASRGEYNVFHASKRQNKTIQLRRKHPKQIALKNRQFFS